MRVFRMSTGGSRNTGLAFAPKGCTIDSFPEGKRIEDWQPILFDLRDAIFAPLIGANICVWLCSEEFRACIEPFIRGDEILFWECEVRSDHYGTRRYYLINVTTLLDVIDYENSYYIDPEEKAGLYYPAFHESKIGDAKIFLPDGWFTLLHVTNEVRLAINRAKQNFNVRFLELKVFP